MSPPHSSGLHQAYKKPNQTRWQMIRSKEAEKPRSETVSLDLLSPPLISLSLSPSVITVAEADL